MITGNCHQGMMMEEKVKESRGGLNKGLTDFGRTELQYFGGKCKVIHLRGRLVSDHCCCVLCGFTIVCIL